jgi:hypothetical protein
MTSGAMRDARHRARMDRIRALLDRTAQDAAQWWEGWQRQDVAAVIRRDGAQAMALTVVDLDIGGMWDHLDQLSGPRMWPLHTLPRLGAMVGPAWTAACRDVASSAAAPPRSSLIAACMLRACMSTCGDAHMEVARAIRAKRATLADEVARAYRVTVLDTGEAVQDGDPRDEEIAGIEGVVLALAILDEDTFLADLPEMA